MPQINIALLKPSHDLVRMMKLCAFGRDARCPPSLPGAPYKSAERQSHRQVPILEKQQGPTTNLNANCRQKYIYIYISPPPTIEQKTKFGLGRLDSWRLERTKNKNEPGLQHHHHRLPRLTPPRPLPTAATGALAVPAGVRCGRCRRRGTPWTKTAFRPGLC